MTSPRKILSDAYNNAGREFLAYRLTRVLCRIENQDDIALHNEVMKELTVMTDKNESDLMLDIADLILMYSRKGLQE